jgi:hypothetical protein
VCGKQQPGVRLPPRGCKDTRLPVTGSKTHRPRQLPSVTKLPAEVAAPEAMVLQQEDRTGSLTHIDATNMHRCVQCMCYGVLCTE